MTEEELLETSKASLFVQSLMLFVNRISSSSDRCGKRPPSKATYNRKRDRRRGQGNGPSMDHGHNRKCRLNAIGWVEKDRDQDRDRDRERDRD